jgi:hypothetical protein
MSGLTMTTAEFNWSQRQMNTIRIREESKDFSGISKGQYRRDELTPREEGGYVKADPRFFAVLEGRLEHLGTCYAENFNFARRRNNPNDRLIIAEITRKDGVPINHCFIVNGRNVIDHSNFRKKCLDFETYNYANRIDRWMEIDYRESGMSVDYVMYAAECLKLGRIGHTKWIYKKGDWDEAASKVL